MIDPEDMKRFLSDAEAKAFVKDNPPDRIKNGTPQWNLRDVLKWKSAGNRKRI